MAMSEEQRRHLELLCSAPRADWLLDELVELATMPGIGWGLPITVVAGGQVLSGNLASPHGLARQIDRDVAGAVRSAMEDHPEEHVREFAETLLPRITGRLAKQVTADTDQEVALLKHRSVAAPDEPVPPELEERAVIREFPRPAFTLENAVLRTPLGPRPVGSVRIVTAHVAAWWMTGHEPVEDEA